MGNTASAITCYPVKTGVMQGRLAVEGVMVISYFLCNISLSLFLCAKETGQSLRVFCERPGQGRNYLNNV